jgi:hypothetical protein
MRVSIVKGDPGYRWNARSFKIKFNGELASNVITADEEKGHVVRYVLGEDGRPKIAPDGQHYLIETVDGKVEVIAETPEGVSLREPKVAVEPHHDAVTQEKSWSVLVYSQIKPGHIRRTLIDEKTLHAKSNATVRAAVSICAGAAAEHLIQTFGDVFEPSVVADAATTAYDRAVRALH